jgi:hypothetical protein
MDVLEFTLVSEGSSDRVLLPILEWLLAQKVLCGVVGTWADLRRVEPAPRSLADKVRCAVEEYPCQLLCIHRDADHATREERAGEIRAALGELEKPPAVCVVPVRMTEAWLLTDEDALRQAAGNPGGKVSLDFPALTGLERVPDPKAFLHSLLRQASGFAGRRLRKFRPDEAAHRLAALVRDYSRLRQLTAFQALEQEVESVLTRIG